MAQTVGQIQVVASINTKDYDAGKKSIEKGNQELESGAKKTSSGFSAAWMGAIAGVAAALTNKFVNAVTSSIDSAVKRVDTLNNSARTFANMGIDAEVSAKSMDALEKSIKGLPTPLDAAVRGMTGLTATYGDIDKGQKVFSALNNAILGFGGSADMVDNAITQLSQLPMDGPLDAQTWNSLRNSGITPVLTAMAKDSGMSVAEMKKAFGGGELTVQDFTDRLLKLNSEGGGGLVSLEQIAKDSTKGIGTGFANMQTAITRGVANIIQQIGSENISNAISGIGDAFTEALKGVSSLINFIKENKTLFTTLAVSVGAATTALVLYNTTMKIVGVTTAAYTAITSYLSLVMSLQAQGLGVVRAAWFALNTVMKANPIGIILTALVALTAGLTYFFTQTETGKKVWEEFMSFLQTAWQAIKDGAKEVGDFFKGAWEQAKDAIDTVKEAFNTVKTAVTDFISAGLDVLNSAIETTIKWIYDWRTWFINIGIVVGTVLLPKLAQLTIQAGISAASWVTSMAVVVGSMIATAASAAWNFAKMAASATWNAIKTSAAWVKSAAKTSFAWVTQTLPKLIVGFAKAAGQAALQAGKTLASWTMAAGRTLLSWTTTFAGYLVQLARVVARTAMAAVRMAASWLLAMGPLGLIIAVVAGLAALIIANWDTVKGWLAVFWKWLKDGFSAAWDFITGVWEGVSNFFKGVWDGIKNAFGAVADWFKNTFSKAWEAVKNVFSAGGRIFNGIKDGISSVFKTVVNGIIGGMNTVIKVPFDAINSALDGIRNISIAGQNPFGWLPSIGVPQIPMLAKGGIVSSPTLAMIGEGRESEAVIPLSKLDDMLNSDSREGVEITQTNNIYNEVDMDRAMRNLAWRISY